MFALRTLALASVVALAAFTAPPTAPDQNVGVISLYNASSFVVTHVYISDCGTNSWEDDLLDYDEVMMPGQDVEVEVETGCWDMMAIVEGDYELDTYSIGVGPGEYHQWQITNN